MSGKSTESGFEAIGFVSLIALCVFIIGGVGYLIGSGPNDVYFVDGAPYSSASYEIVEYRGKKYKLFPTKPEYKTRFDPPVFLDKEKTIIQWGGFKYKITKVETKYVEAKKEAEKNQTDGPCKVKGDK